MSTLSKKLVAICLATAFSMVMYGCGGGGGSSSPAPMDDDDDMTVTPIECPDGQEPNAANDACVKTAATLAAEAVAATKAAATKTTAIKAESMQTTDAGLGGTARTDADESTTETTDDVYGLEIKRDGDGTTVKITDPNMAADDDPKFMQAMDLGSGRTMHTRTMEADTDGNVVEETVIVSTDIEAPKATAFAKVTGQALNARDLDAATDADGDGTATNDFTALTVDESSAAVRALVKSSEFAAGAGSQTVLTFGFDDAATTSTDEAGEVEGTYNGAMGTYRCNGGTACTVTLNDKGMITAMSAGWVFTPDSGATSDVPDADYLHYGVWLKKTTDDDGVVTYNEVETFAGSSVAATGDVATVLGSATYSGGATGVYVHQVRNPAGNIDSATSGHFSADVALTAYFGQTVDDASTDGVDESGQIAPTLLHTISGTINNFMLSGHDTGPGWSVSLEKSAVGTTTGVETGVAKGGGDNGSYTATYHGPIAAVNGVVPAPHTVVGEFNAFFSNGSVAGAFGARKD